MGKRFEEALHLSRCINDQQTHKEMFKFIIRSVNEN